MSEFENKLARLEKICEQLRSGSTDLADSLKLFEEGIALVQKLEREIKGAEHRVEILMNDPHDIDARPDLSLFVGKDTDSEGDQQEDSEKE